MGYIETYAFVLKVVPLLVDVDMTNLDTSFQLMGIPIRDLSMTILDQ